MLSRSFLKFWENIAKAARQQDEPPATYGDVIEVPKGHGQLTHQPMRKLVDESSLRKAALA